MKKLPVILLLLLALAPAVRSQDVFELLRKDDIAAVKALIEKTPQLVQARDGQGMTLLHYAASGRDAGFIDLLIDKGAELEAKNAAGETPLMIAAANDRPEAAAALIKRGAALETKNDYGRTSLVLCARERGQAATGRLLIDAGADVNAADKFGSSALELAAWRGKAEFVDLLLEKGARLPEPGEKWHGLLHMAASQGLDALFQRLAGQVRDLKAATGEGLLRAAAEGGSAEIVRLLLEKGFDAASADRFGWTPLHHAARDGRIDAARALVERGAPLDARSIMGQTAYNVARERAMEAVAGFLAEKGADRSDIKFPVLEGDYLGQAPPTDKPELFAPGIISSIWGLHSTAVFSPDGNEVYWAPMMTFPGEAYSRGGLLMMKRAKGRWMPPVWAPFSGPNGQDDVPFFSSDGKRLYFISRRPLPGESQRGSEKIWYADRTSDSWSEPTPLDPNVNSMHMHWEFSLDLAGNVYFAGNSPGGLGMNDIYVARFVDGKFEKPVNAGPPVNSAAGEESPFIAPDGSYLLFSRQYDLWVSFRGAGDAWSEPVNLGPGVNSPSIELCPVVSADGKYLFFLSQRDGESHAYWVRADVIEKARPAVRVGDRFVVGKEKQRSGEIRGCTSFSFSHKGHPVFASNYDNDLTSGMIFVNKRGLHKTGWEPSSSGETASWVANYGSITFTCVGYQLAWAGMNEKGLTISTMALGETVNPVPDERPPLVSPLWMQYILDTCATVEDLMRSDGKVRIMDTVDHYLVCDREGNCATVEFLDGKMVCHTAGDLPVRALANRPYAVCVDNWKKKSELQGDPYDSRSRFNRAAEMMAAFDPAKSSAVKYAFQILDSLRPPRNPEVTRWSIVFDTGNLEIHYKSYDNRSIRRIAFREFDFSCCTPAKMLNVHNKLSGDISGAFEDYSHDLSLEFMLKAVLEQRPDFPKEQIAPLLGLMEGYRCEPKDRRLMDLP